MEYSDEKQEYEVSYAQLEQLGPRQRDGFDAIAHLIKDGAGMAAALRHAGQLRIDPAERFVMLCSIYYDKFGGDSFTVNWERILNKIPHVKWIAYRNPIGFILGARIINRQGKVDLTKFNLTCSNYAGILETENISQADVLRYGRYWETLLKND